MEYFKKISTLVVSITAFIVLLGFFGVPILKWIHDSTYNDITALFFFVVLLFAFYAMYPSSIYDFWWQRFWAGIALISIPFLFSYMISFGWGWQISPFVVIVTLLYIIAIFLCFFIRKKVKLYGQKMNKLLHAMLVFPLFASLLSWCFLYFNNKFVGFKKLIEDESVGRLLHLSGFYFLPFIAFIIGISALINSGQVKKRWLFIAYTGMLLAQVFLYRFYYVVAYYCLVGE